MNRDHHRLTCGLQRKRLWIVLVLVVLASAFTIQGTDAENQTIEYRTAKALFLDFDRYGSKRDDETNAFVISVINSLDPTFLTCHWVGRMEPDDLFPRAFDSHHRPEAYAQGTPYRTLDVLNAVLSDDPDNIDALRDRALHYVEARATSRAVEDLTHALTLSDNVGELLALRGLVQGTGLPSVGQAVSVIEDLEAAIAAGFDGPGVRFVLGMKIHWREIPGSLMYGNEESARHLVTAISLVDERQQPLTFYEVMSAYHAALNLVRYKRKSVALLVDLDEVNESDLQHADLRYWVELLRYGASYCQSKKSAAELEYWLPLLERSNIENNP